MSSDLAAAARSLRYAGFDAVREFVSRTYHSVRSQSTPNPVLAREWDLLVVLDACRADAFEAVLNRGDYEFDASGTATSPASTSTEWLESVFGAASDDALADVAYVTGNPYTARTVDTDRLGYVDEVWRHSWDADLGTIPPRPVTDAAIRAGRSPVSSKHEADDANGDDANGDNANGDNANADNANGDDGPSRLVVHYMQPHFPTVFDDGDGDNGGAGDGGGMALDDWGDQPMSVWEELRFGTRSVEDAWADYERNLEAVLADVELLLANVDADTAVLTADHGNAFGDHHIYGHPGGVDIPALREVPWCVTTATDERTHDPGEAAGGTSDEPSGGTDVDETDQNVIDDRLESLGYKV